MSYVKICSVYWCTFVIIMACFCVFCVHYTFADEGSTLYSKEIKIFATHSLIFFVLLWKSNSTSNENRTLQFRQWIKLFIMNYECICCIRCLNRTSDLYRNKVMYRIEINFMISKINSHDKNFDILSIILEVLKFIFDGFKILFFLQIGRLICK